MLVSLAAFPSSMARAEAKAALGGQWMLSGSPEPGVGHLMMNYTLHGRDQGQWGRSLDLAQVRGLRPDAFRARGPVAFDIVRDAGTFICTGTMNGTSGKGAFTLRADAEFARTLERRGVGRPNEDQQARLALSDAGYALLDALEHEGYPVPRVATMVELGEHGVDAPFVTGLASAGFRLGSLDRLRETRDHGLTAEYVQELRRQGLTHLTFEQFMQARDHGVTAEFLQELRKAGYANLSYSELLEARDHGVSEDFIVALSEAGFVRLPLEAVVRARDHGLDARLARRARRELGLKATIDDAIEWRDRGGR